MTVEGDPLCARCATRLGKRGDPEVPRLLEGFCPQCGGNEPFEPDDAVIEPVPVCGAGAAVAK